MVKSVDLSIPQLSIQETLLFSFTCALIVHATYKRYEVLPSSFLPTFLLLGLPPLLTIPLYARHFSIWLSLALSCLIFNSSLLSSIVIYRLSPIHPLAKYPGPYIARVTKFWTLWITLRGKHNEYVKSLHDKYGPYVRTGPNEISCIDLNVMSDILGPVGSGMPKGPMWEVRANPDSPPSLIAIRDMHEHAKQRKAWNRAFNTVAVKEDYAPIIKNRVLQLANSLAKQSKEGSGEGVNLSKWFGYFAFDFMGDMAFGGGFEFMRDGDEQGLLHLMDMRVKWLAHQIHIPWGTRLALKLPSFTGNAMKFRKFAVACAKKRQELGSSVRDLFYHLTNEDGLQLAPMTLAAILSTGELAIIAGSDTTANALSGIFYHLLTNPEDYKRLQQEVDSAFPRDEGDAVDSTKLAGMPILNAVINESLRLQPAVMTYIQRSPAKGSGGHMLGGRFIPEGTAVLFPIYTLQRDRANFSPRPDDFIPDRWLGDAPESSTEKWQTNAAAFIPFSSGPANCAGKNLALAEMRCVVAVLVQRFQFAFPDDYDVKEWKEKLTDRFITQTGRLPVTVTPR